MVRIWTRICDRAMYSVSGEGENVTGRKEERGGWRALIKRSSQAPSEERCVGNPLKERAARSSKGRLHAKSFASRKG